MTSIDCVCVCVCVCVCARENNRVLCDGKLYIIYNIYKCEGDRERYREEI